MYKQDLKVQNKRLRKKNQNARINDPITELNEQQGKGKNEELSEQGKCQELNNPMIYSGDNKDLFALLSHNPSPAIKDLLQKKLWTNMVWD